MLLYHISQYSNYCTTYIHYYDKRLEPTPKLGLQSVVSTARRLSLLCETV